MAVAFDSDQVMLTWLAALQDAVGPLRLFDAHTHIGANDPDGYKQTAEQLLAGLALADSRGVVFAMHEPDGYRAANDASLQAAADSDGRVVAFCRVDPRTDPVGEATRCLDAGACGIKLHPRAEQFGMDEPALRGLVELAHDRHVPILIHAGRGIPALGEYTMQYAHEFPRARFILAHAAISDLAWLWRRLPELPNVFIDTAWWNPIDLVALFTLVPPSHIVWASDSPYGSPVTAGVLGGRCMLQAGLTPEQARGVFGGQLERIVAREERLELGAAPGPHSTPALHPALERVVGNLLGAVGRAFVRADFSEPVALARLACDPGDDEVGDVCERIVHLLDLFEDNLAPPADGQRLPASGRMLIAALVLARTPDVPMPA